jgi:hypothetical protein
MPIRILGVALFILFTCAAKDIKIHGYVTAVNGPGNFEVDEYRIFRDESIKLDFDFDDDDDNRLDYPKDIRVGTELEIKGDFDAAAGRLKAKSIKVFTRESKKLKRTALLDRIPALERSGEKWTGSIRIDGQTVLVNENTLVTIVPNTSQKKATKAAQKASKDRAKRADTAEDEAETGLTRLNDVHVNMYVSYEGERDPSGTVTAKKIQFHDNELTNSEARLWKSLNPKIKAFRETKPGELSLGKAGKFKITPNAELQAYVRSLAETLIPESQRRLAPGDANRIPFQFLVIDEKYPNAFATANGVVAVFTPMLDTVENEAQLAFILSHEIAHATQEHTLRQIEFHKKKRTMLAIGAAVASAYGAHNVSDLLNLTSAAIANGYQRYLENQADRVGMEYMVAAGYDPREAPRAWKAIALRHGDKRTNFFWDSHDNHSTRRSYLMNELRMNHKDLDMSQLRKDSEKFQQMKKSLALKPGKKSKVKVTR